MSIEQRVMEIIGEELGINRSDIELSDKLCDDLGADELELVNISINIEKQLSIKLPDTDFDTLGSFSVSDLVSIAKLSEKKSEEDINREQQPRRLHYFYAYEALPAIFFKDPGWFMSVLAGTDAYQFLIDTWESAHQQLNCDYISPDGLGSKSGNVKETRLAIIQFPEPLHLAEAHYACAVYGSQLHAYYTCEMSVGQSTVLGCRTQKGQRSNLGSRQGVPSAQEFLEWVFQRAGA